MKHEQIVTIRTPSEYYGDQYVSGRYYTGRYGGTLYEKDGCWVRVDNYRVKISNRDIITYEDFAKKE